VAQDVDRLRPENELVEILGVSDIDGAVARLRIWHNTCITPALIRGHSAHYNVHGDHYGDNYRQLECRFGTPPRIETAGMRSHRREADQSGTEADAKWELIPKDDMLM